MDGGVKSWPYSESEGSVFCKMWSKSMCTGQVVPSPRRQWWPWWYSPPPASASVPSAPRCASGAQPAAAACVLHSRAAAVPAVAAAGPLSAPCWPIAVSGSLAAVLTPLAGSEWSCGQERTREGLM